MGFMGTGGIFNHDDMGVPGSSGIPNKMLNNNIRATYGDITLSNRAIYSGKLFNEMKDGYG
jgi:hypothetical protein